jgi:hypothetical protein
VRPVVVLEIPVVGPGHMSQTRKQECREQYCFRQWGAVFQSFHN